MSNPQIPNRASASRVRAGMYQTTNQMFQNPAVVALAAAFGLVIIAAVIATIKGLAEDMEKYQQSTRK